MTHDDDGTNAPLRLYERVRQQRAGFDAESMRLDEYATLVKRQLELLGEDPNRDGLARTPDRVARSMEWLTQGLRGRPARCRGDRACSRTNTTT